MGDFSGQNTSNASWIHYQAKYGTLQGYASTTAIMQSVYSDGPVSTGIWLTGGGTPNTLVNYKGGIYDCSFQGGGFAFHAVDIIGWGTDPKTGLDYWVARNSWGDGWGEDYLNPSANCTK